MDEPWWSGEEWLEHESDIWQEYCHTVLDRFEPEEKFSIVKTVNEYRSFLEGHLRAEMQRVADKLNRARHADD